MKPARHRLLDVEAPCPAPIYWADVLKASPPANGPRPVSLLAPVRLIGGAFNPMGWTRQPRAAHLPR